MLKFEIESLEGVDETLHPMYEESGGKYRLKVEGIPSGDGGLSERIKKLEENNKALLSEKLEAKSAAEKAALEAAKKTGDIDALEKSWGEKLNNSLSAKDQEISLRDQMIQSLTVGSTATMLAAELFGEHADLMMPHLNGRLKTEIVDGQPKVRVLDANGLPSAMTIDDLKQEMKNSPKFAAFVVGSRASGGGPAGKGGSNTGDTMKRTQFDQLPPRAKAEFMSKGGTLKDG